MRKHKNHKFITLVVLCLTVFSLLFVSISASAIEEPSEIKQSYIIDKTHKVTLNITAKNADHQTIPNVGYSLYFLSDDLNAIPSSADDVDKSKLSKLEMPLTDGKGKTSITTDKQGVYLVSCTQTPQGVTSGKDFIITLPYSEGGRTWQYELNATPKLVITTKPENIETTGSGDKIESNGSSDVINTGDDTMAFVVPITLGINVSMIGVILCLKERKVKQ